ncbi:MAG: hypothetical protein EU551_02940 [Promethearchaeota archaeon]|nr:MAG: hypothetical protein EU551_02940 [Candidatus Lokiarchaeota archaeon]
MTDLDKWDHIMLEKVCRALCPFYKEGQEIRETEYQCGAYWIVKEKLKSDEVTIEELNKWMEVLKDRKNQR